MPRAWCGRLEGEGGCNAWRLSLCSVCMQFKCCGSNNYTDWADSLWIKSPEANGRKVPDSCCKTITDLCGRRDHPSNIYKEVKSKRASEPLVIKYVKEVGQECGCWVDAANYQ